jgi:hypothetical protein
VILILACSIVSCRNREAAKDIPVMTLSQKIARFAPTEITADISSLPAGERKALDKIIEASRLMDDIFLRQVWRGNTALLERLRADTSAGAQERLHYFCINMAPWSQLDSNTAFLPGVPERPLGAGYYPEDMTKD